MYAFCQDMPGVTAEQHAQVDALIDASALADCLVHVVGPYDGGVRMIDVWTTEAAFRRFQTEVLWPALDRLGPTFGSEAPEPFVVLDVTGEGRGALTTVATG